MLYCLYLIAAFPVFEKTFSKAGGKNKGFLTKNSYYIVVKRNKSFFEKDNILTEKKKKNEDLKTIIKEKEKRKEKQKEKEKK